MVMVSILQTLCGARAMQIQAALTVRGPKSVIGSGRTLGGEPGSFPWDPVTPYQVRALTSAVTRRRRSVRSLPRAKRTR